MSKNNGGGVKQTPKKQIRQENALNRLQNQLKTGLKPVLECVEEIGSSVWAAIPLTEKDIFRINKEMVILKSRI